MNYPNLSVLIGIAIGSIAGAATAQMDQNRAEMRAELTERQGTPVAEVQQDGQTAIVVQYPTGTPFSRSAGTGGFSDATVVTRRVFQSMDDDNSGALEPGEVPLTITLGQRFADYDINGDGLIAKNEFQSYSAAQRWLQGEQDPPRFDVATPGAGSDAGLNVDIVEVDAGDD